MNLQKSGSLGDVSKSRLKKYLGGGWREYYPDGSYIWITYNGLNKMWCATYRDEKGDLIGKAQHHVDRGGVVELVKKECYLGGV